MQLSPAAAVTAMIVLLSTRSSH
jgi:hypothetical protein